MKIREGFILRDIAGDTIAMPCGDMELNGMITLNPTGAFLWRLLENETTVQELAAALVKEYAIDEATAKSAVESFVKKLKDHEFLA